MGAAEKEDFDFAPPSPPPSPKSIRAAAADIGFSCLSASYGAFNVHGLTGHCGWRGKLDILKVKTSKRTRGEGTERISDEIWTQMGCVGRGGRIEQHACRSVRASNHNCRGPLVALFLSFFFWFLSFWVRNRSYLYLHQRRRSGKSPRREKCGEK